MGEPSILEPPELLRLCIDLLVAIRLLASAVGVLSPAGLTGVSPSTAIAIRLWHDMRLDSVLSPTL